MSSAEGILNFDSNGFYFEIFIDENMNLNDQHFCCDNRNSKNVDKTDPALIFENNKHQRSPLGIIDPTLVFENMNHHRFPLETIFEDSLEHVEVLLF